MAAGTRAKALHDGSFVWADLNFFDFASTAPNQFLVRAAGGVGINKNNPGSALDVNGTVSATAFVGSGSGLTGVAPASHTHSAADITSGTLADVRLSANVALLTGVQTFTGAKTFQNITVADGSGASFSGGSMRVGINAANGDSKLIYFGDNQYVSIGEDVADDRMQLTGSTFVFTNRAGGGRVGIGRVPSVNKLEVEGEASKTTASSWAANSDRRIKTAIGTITNALEKIEQVRLVTFHYTEDYRREHPTIGNRAYANVIAQEFQKAFPDDVKGSGDKLPNGDEILQVDTYPLTIYSAAAVQELHHALKEKETRITELERRLSALEAMVTRGIAGAADRDAKANANR
jgi:hypothetical protein